MKRLLIIILFTFCSFQLIKAQDNPCNMQWSPWEVALSTGSGGILYSVQHARCTSTGICGWPKIGLQHTLPYNVSLSIKLKGFDCDGKTVTGEFSTGGNEIPPYKEDKGTGNWHMFKTVTEVLRVEAYYSDGNDKYRILYDKEKGINETYINGKTRAEINIEKQNKLAEEKKQKAEEEKQAKEEKLKKEQREKKDKEQQTKLKADQADQSAAAKKSSSKSSKETSESSGDSKTASSYISPELAYQNSRKQYHQTEAEQQKQNAQQAQTAFAGTAAAFGGLAMSGINSNDQNNFFRGKSSHLGGFIGFASPNIPIISDKLESSENGNKFSSSVQTPAQVGLTLGGSYHPIITDHFSLGINASGTYAFGLEFLNGGGSSGSYGRSDVTTNSSISTLNYTFGGEIAVGARPVKILGGYYYNHYNTTYTNTSSDDIYVGSQTHTYTTTETGEAVYNAQRIEAGLRLGSYQKSCFDLIYGIESFKNYDGSKITNPVYKLVIWLPSYFKIFAEYSNYTVYGSNKYDWANDKKQGMFINVGLVYNKDRFWEK